MWNHLCRIIPLLVCVRANLNAALGGLCGAKMFRDVESDCLYDSESTSLAQTMFGCVKAAFSDSGVSVVSSPMELYDICTKVQRHRRSAGVCLCCLRLFRVRLPPEHGVFSM